MYFNFILLNRKKKKHRFAALIVLFLPIPIVFTLMTAVISHNASCMILSLLLIMVFLFFCRKLMNHGSCIGWNYLEGMEVFRGHCHLAPYTLLRGSEIRKRPSLLYRNVLFLAKDSNEAAAFGPADSPDFFIPKLTRSVAPNELHVDCMNGIMYLNPKTYHSMKTYTIFRPLMTN